MPAVADLGCGDAVAPPGDLVTQYAEPVERPARPRRAAPRPPWSHCAAIPPVAAKELVSALTGQDDLESRLVCRPREGPGRQDRVISGRIVDTRYDLRQQFPKVCLSEHDLDVFSPHRLR